MVIIAPSIPKIHVSDYRLCLIFDCLLYHVYPGEELLLVYDYDFKFGENFYICLTEEAKDWVLNR